MRHSRAEVVERTVREFERLDAVVRSLQPAGWARLVARPETQDPWTVKDALAHVVHWKADQARRARGERRPAEERGLDVHAGNRLIYLRWRDRSADEVLAWHSAVQAELLAALEAAPNGWFGGRERNAVWPYDLDGHSAFHRVRDIERAVRR